MKRAKGLITTEILTLREKIVNIAQLEITITEAYQIIGNNLTPNGFYQQCSILKKLGYIEFCGYRQLSHRSRSTLMVAKAKTYTHNNVIHPKVITNVHVYSCNDRHWTKSEPKRTEVYIGTSFNITGW